MARRKEIRAAVRALLDELEEQYTGGNDYGFFTVSGTRTDDDGNEEVEVNWPKLRKLQLAVEAVLRTKATVPPSEDEGADEDA